MTTANDYFLLLGLERKYTLNPAAVRRNFYTQSAATHPDRVATQDSAAQAEALQKTALLNEALRVLSHPMLRLGHLLALEGYPLPENYALPPAFMMEMMELNELAEEDPKAAGAQLQTFQETWQQALDALTARYESGERTEALFSALQEVYFRKKYLERVSI